MKRARLLILFMALMLLCCACILLTGAVGSKEDPLISLNYLYHRFAPQVQESVGASITEQLAETGDELNGRLEGIWFPENREGEFASQFTPLELQDGAVLELSDFSSFVLLQGEGKLMVLEGEVLDLSTGGVCADGSFLVHRHRYFAAEAARARIRLYGDPASGMVDGFYSVDNESVMPTEERFLDVSDGFWAAPYIWRLYELGVVNGVETHRFAPGDMVTRAAFVTILGRLFGVDTAAYERESFGDVKSGSWYGPYVAWAAEQGITVGYDDGSFRPDQQISREQLAVMLQRYLRLTGLESAPEEREAFADESAVSGWALEAVCLMRDMGLMNGRGENRFEPKGTATRAEICTVVCRLADLNAARG